MTRQSAADRPFRSSPQGHARARRSRSTTRFIGLALLALFLPALASAQGLAGDPPETLIFESRAPGHLGGGLSVNSNALHGHTFRVTERTQITRIGTYAEAFQARTAFMALYRVGMPAASPDVVADSQLIATSLIDVPATGFGNPVEVSTALTATLDPGWYAVMIGTGRHGATAPDHSITVVGTGTPTTPMSRGPYSVNTTTNAMTLQGTTARYFVYGHSLPPVMPPATDYLFETATPAAWWSSSGFTLSNSQFVAVRFPIERATRVDRLSAWLGFGNGSTIFAAIYPLSGPTGNPPTPNSAAFDTARIHTSLIAVGSWDEYSVDLGGLELAPGHYAVVFGGQRFGATGTAGLVGAEDQIVAPGSLVSAGGTWFANNNYAVRLTGVVPEWTVTPQHMDFGPVPQSGVGTRSVTVSNLRDDASLQLAAIDLDGDAFVLDDDAEACLVIAAASQCTFQVHYLADHVGEDQGNVEILALAVPDHAAVLLSAETVPSATVNASVQGNGTIDPVGDRLVAIGDSLTLTLSPAVGHHLEQITGTCGGTLDGLVFTTDVINENCTVIAHFAIDTFSVSGDVLGNGSIDPTGIQIVDWGDTASYSLIADPGHHVETVTGTCGGEVVGLVYTTAPITADCAFTIRFAVDTHMVHASSAGNGSITPAGALTVDWGSSPSFTLKPDAGYEIDQVVSDCGGALLGSVYQTAPIIADCSVQAQFALAPATTLSVVSGSNQSTQVDTDFSAPLVVLVSNDAGLPVPGVSVQFQAPTGGASAIVLASASSDSNGEVSVHASANTVAGSYSVLASADGLTGPVSFQLDNLAGPAEQMIVLGGNGQSAQVGEAFAEALHLRVLDAHDNPVPAAQVMFVAPSSGASAVLAPATIATNEHGEAQTIATANAVPGTYQVNAAIVDSNASAQFALENLAPKLALSITIDDGRDHIAYGEINDYLVTIGNAGSDPATGVEVLVSLPDQLDVALSEWLCLDPGSGCSANGAGSLVDSGVTVPAGGSVRYQILTPVLEEAPGERIEIDAYAESTYHEPVQGFDHTWLVLYRDGFESEAPHTDEVP